jgi:ABC-type phosphate transport system substrate-binding protein
MARDAHRAGIRRLWRSAPERLAVAVAAVLLSSIAAAQPIIVQGSTTFNRRVMEPHQAEIEAASGQRLTVIPNKTTPGLVALLEGRAQMTMISAPLESDIQELQKILPGCSCQRLKAFEVMATRVAIGVHPSNPVREATIDTLKKVLRGEITNWRELGGADLPIRLALAAGGGIVAVVETELLGGRRPDLKNMIYVNTPVQLVQVMEQEPGVLGFAQLPLVKQRGLPEIATDRPLQTTLNLVTLDEPTPAMRAVIDAARRIANKAM